MSGTTDEERAAFAARLKKAMKGAGPPWEGAGISTIARNFNLIHPGEGVSVHAVRKWLCAESIPTHAKLKTLAEALGVSAHWLSYGEGEALSGETVSAADRLFLAEFQKLPPPAQQLIRKMVRSVGKLYED